MSHTIVVHPAFKILNTEPGRFSDEARRTLRELAYVDEIEADRKYLLEHGAHYDCFFICLRNVIDKDVLDRAIRLKCIVTPTTGVNHIDMEIARSKDITVLSLKGETKFLENVTATAELSWGLLLALLRKIPTAHQSVMAGEWARDNFYGRELRGKTLGVIGYGRLGKMVAAYGRVFGMQVFAYDCEPQSTAEIEFLGLSELLARSDVISVNLSLTDDTRGLLNQERFSEMKSGAVLLNTARGEIVDESALLGALLDGRLSGAAIDVMADEISIDSSWLMNSRLRIYANEHDNMIITPHVGGVTLESVEKTNRFMIDKLGTYLKNMVGKCAL